MELTELLAGTTLIITYWHKFVLHVGDLLVEQLTILIQNHGLQEIPWLLIQTIMQIS